MKTSVMVKLTNWKIKMLTGKVWGVYNFPNNLLEKWKNNKLKNNKIYYSKLRVE
jgi:hypothetical protein